MAGLSVRDSSGIGDTGVPFSSDGAGDIGKTGKREGGVGDSDGTDESSSDSGKNGVAGGRAGLSSVFSLAPSEK